MILKTRSECGRLVLVIQFFDLKKIIIDKNARIEDYFIKST